MMYEQEFYYWTHPWLNGKEAKILEYVASDIWLGEEVGTPSPGWWAEFLKDPGRFTYGKIILAENRWVEFEGTERFECDGRIYRSKVYKLFFLPLKIDIWDGKNIGIPLDYFEQLRIYDVYILKENPLREDKNETIQP